MAGSTCIVYGLLNKNDTEKVPIMVCETAESKPKLMAVAKSMFPNMFNMEIKVLSKTGKAALKFKNQSKKIDYMEKVGKKMSEKSLSKWISDVNAKYPEMKLAERK